MVAPIYKQGMAIVEGRSLADKRQKTCWRLPYELSILGDSNSSTRTALSTIMHRIVTAQKRIDDMATAVSPKVFAPSSYRIDDIPPTPRLRPAICGGILDIIEPVIKK